MAKDMVLVADDDREIVDSIRRLLQREGLDSLGAYDGEEALRLLETHTDVRLLLLDVMMPRLDGLSALMRLRQSRNLPVIILSAKAEESDRLLGLQMGADDYICKPFLPAELIARVRSQLRRYLVLGGAGAAMEPMPSGLQLDTDAREAVVNGRRVKLTPTELRIFELLMRNRGRVFSADEIYERVWGEAPFSSENTVMVHIRRLREKIEDTPSEPKYLKVVWGLGYKLEKDG